MSLSVELPFGSEVSYQWQINTGTEELPQWENVEGNIMYSGTQSSQMNIDNATDLNYRKSIPRFGYQPNV